MTIMQLDKELKSVIDAHSVYGAECILHALVRACAGHPYLAGEDIKRILKKVIEREEKMQEAERSEEWQA